MRWHLCAVGIDSSQAGVPLAQLYSLVVQLTNGISSYFVVWKDVKREGKLHSMPDHSGPFCRWLTNLLRFTALVSDLLSWQKTGHHLQCRRYMLGASQAYPFLGAFLRCSECWPRRIPSKRGSRYIADIDILINGVLQLHSDGMSFFSSQTIFLRRISPG